MASNLAKNQQKLVTPFDIHATLQHLLHLPSNFTPRETYQKSIFQGISENRSCEDARIADHWCVCQSWHYADKDSPLVKNGTMLLVNAINGFFLIIEKV